MKSIREVLEYPPTKEIKCKRCDGSGIVNRRGMVSSDPCPDCKMDGYYGKSGKVDVTDFEETEKLIREIILFEVEEELPTSEQYKKACARLRKNFKI